MITQITEGEQALQRELDRAIAASHAMVEMGGKLILERDELSRLYENALKREYTLQQERDKLAAELKSLRDSVVELPDHPEPHTMKWLMCEFDAIRDYGNRRAMAERERCAKVCEEHATKYLNRDVRNQHSHGAGLGASIFADAIRKGE